MVSTVQSFTKISSLTDLTDHVNFSAGPDELNILAIDFDLTLVEARSILGSVRLSRFLSTSTMQKIDSEAKYHWTAKVREAISFKSCEPFEKANKVLKDARDKGWIPVIATYRGKDMEQSTYRHVKESELAFSPQEVIFTEENPDVKGKLFSKDESIIRRMKSLPQWATCKKIRIVFTDDSPECCKEVARIAEKVKNATVTCFLYINDKASNPDFSESELKQLVVELYAYTRKLPIPVTYTESDVKEALAGLGMQKIGTAEVHEAIVKIAEGKALHCIHILVQESPLPSPTS